MTDLITYYEYNRIPKDGDDVAILSLDVVLFDGETPEDAAQLLAKGKKVTWEIKPSGNCWPQIDFQGKQSELWRVRHSYKCLGNSGRRPGETEEDKSEALHNRWLLFDSPDDEKDCLANEIGWRCEKGLVIFDEEGYFMVIDGGPGPSPETGEHHEAIYHLEAHDGTEWHGPMEIMTILACRDELRLMVPK